MPVGTFAEEFHATRHKPGGEDDIWSGLSSGQKAAALAALGLAGGAAAVDGSNISSAAAWRTALGLGTAATHANSDYVAAGDAALTDQRAPKDVTDWVAGTTYAKGVLVLSPAGAYAPGHTSLVQALATFTAGGSFSASNWKHLADFPVVPKISSRMSGSVTTVGSGELLLATATTIPPSSLSSSTFLRYGMEALQTVVAGSGVINFRCKVNGTTIISGNLSANQTAAASNQPVSVEGKLYVVSTGSSGTMIGSEFRSTYSTAGALSAVAWDLATAAVTVDISSGLTVAFYVNFAGSGVGQSCNILNGYVEHVK